MKINGPVNVPPMIPITKSNCGNNSAIVTANAIMNERKMHRLKLKSLGKKEKRKICEIPERKIRWIFGMECAYPSECVNILRYFETELNYQPHVINTVAPLPKVLLHKVYYFVATFAEHLPLFQCHIDTLLEWLSLSKERK